MNDSRDDGASAPADAAHGAPDDAIRGADTDARRLHPADARPAAAAIAVLPRPRRVRRFLGWWMLLSLVLAACVACLAIGASVFHATPVHIVIDGDDLSGVSIDGASFAVQALVFACLAAATLLVLLLVPLVALVVVGSIVFAVVAGFGTPLVILAFALAVLTSPIWVVALVVWFFARRRRAHSATMAA
jgi:hypothetical protein